MVGNAKSVLVALLFFGSASLVLAGTPLGSDHYGSAATQGAASVAKSDDRTGAMNRAAKPVTARRRLGPSHHSFPSYRVPWSVIMAAPAARWFGSN